MTGAQVIQLIALSLVPAVFVLLCGLIERRKIWREHMKEKERIRREALRQLGYESTEQFMHAIGLDEKLHLSLPRKD